MGYVGVRQGMCAPIVELVGRPDPPVQALIPVGGRHACVQAYK